MGVVRERARANAHLNRDITDRVLHAHYPPLNFGLYVKTHVLVLIFFSLSFSMKCPKFSGISYAYQKQEPKTVIIHLMVGIGYFVGGMNSFTQESLY